jgi:predicted transcriptional regulator
MPVRVSPEVWATVKTAVLLCLANDGEVTTRGVASYAEEYDATEVTQARAYRVLNDMWERGLLDRRVSNGPTQYVYKWKDVDENAGVWTRET